MSFLCPKSSNVSSFPKVVWLLSASLTVTSQIWEWFSQRCEETFPHPLPLQQTPFLRWEHPSSSPPNSHRALWVGCWLGSQLREHLEAGIRTSLQLQLFILFSSSSMLAGDWTERKKSFLRCSVGSNYKTKQQTSLPNITHLGPGRLKQKALCVQGRKKNLKGLDHTPPSLFTSVTQDLEGSWQFLRAQNNS